MQSRFGRRPEPGGVSFESDRLRSTDNKRRRTFSRDMQDHSRMGTDHETRRGRSRAARKRDRT
eukprot:6279813-Karenia_brevis.AAC.1